MNDALTNRLIWIDLEMTGLNPDADRILEIATVVTDTELQVIAEGPVLAINQTDACLAQMDEWNTSHHTQSGLITRVTNSTFDEHTAEIMTLHFLKQQVAANTSPICGNSICQDRRFLFRYMPQLEKYFHYRHLDVSTLKILAEHWAPDIASQLNKLSKHLALSDIYDSIAELQYYRKHLFK